MGSKLTIYREIIVFNHNSSSHKQTEQEKWVPRTSRILVYLLAVQWQKVSHAQPTQPTHQFNLHKAISMEPTNKVKIESPTDQTNLKSKVFAFI